MAKSHVNEKLKTKFYSQGNRIAGMGITEDRYDDESFPDHNPFNNHSTSFWHKPVKVEPEPIKTYKLSEEELNYYKTLGAE